MFTNKSVELESPAMLVPHDSDSLNARPGAAGLSASDPASAPPAAPAWPGRRGDFSGYAAKSGRAGARTCGTEPLALNLGPGGGGGGGGGDPTVQASPGPTGARPRARGRQQKY